MPTFHMKLFSRRMIRIGLCNFATKREMFHRFFASVRNENAFISILPQKHRHFTFFCRHDDFCMRAGIRIVRFGRRAQRILRNFRWGPKLGQLWILFCVFVIFCNGIIVIVHLDMIAWWKEMLNCDYKIQFLGWRASSFFFSFYKVLLCHARARADCVDCWNLFDAQRHLSSSKAQFLQQR